MRLIKDDQINRRQQLAMAAIAQGHVRKKQVMIDPDHIGLGGVFSGLEDKAFAVMLTLRSQAIIHGGGDQGF